MLLSRADTRAAGAAWIREHVAPGATIGLINQRACFPWLQPTTAQIEAARQAWGGAGESLVRYRQAVEHDDEPEYRQVRTVTGEKGWYDLLALHPLPDCTPDWIMTADYPIGEVYFRGGGGPWLDELLAAQYVQRWRINPLGPGGADNAYDRQDLFFLPYGGFAGVERPGPALTIYERRAAAPGASAR